MGCQILEPMVGVEPTTYALQKRCSAIELHRPTVYHPTGDPPQGDKTAALPLSYVGKRCGTLPLRADVSVGRPTVASALRWQNSECTGSRFHYCLSS